MYKMFVGLHFKLFASGGSKFANPLFSVQYSTASATRRHPRAPLHPPVFLRLAPPTAPRRHPRAPRHPPVFLRPAARLPPQLRVIRVHLALPASSFGPAPPAKPRRHPRAPLSLPVSPSGLSRRRELRAQLGFILEHTALRLRFFRLAPLTATRCFPRSPRLMYALLPYRASYPCTKLINTTLPSVSRPRAA